MGYYPFDFVSVKFYLFFSEQEDLVEANLPGAIVQPPNTYTQKAWNLVLRVEITALYYFTVQARLSLHGTTSRPNEMVQIHEYISPIFF